MPTCHPVQVTDYRVILDFEDQGCYGSDPGSPNAVLLPFTTLNTKENQVPQATAVLYGRNMGRPFYGDKTVDGTLVGPVDPAAHYYILRAVFGGPSYSSGTYTFKVGPSVPSFILEKQLYHLGDYFKCKGCIANTYSITFGGNGQLLYNLALMGAQEVHSKTSYDSTPLEYRDATFNFQNNEISFYIDDVLADSAIDKFSFTLTNGVAIAHGFNGYGVGTVGSVQPVSVTGTIGGTFIDYQTLWQKGYDHTTVKLEIRVTHGSDMISWIFPEVELSHESPDITGPAVPQFNLTWNAFYATGVDASTMLVEYTSTEVYSTTSTSSSSSSTTTSTTRDLTP